MIIKRTFISLALGLLGSTLIAGGAWAQTINAKFSVTLPEKSHQGQGAARFAELVNQKTKDASRSRCISTPPWATMCR